MTWENLSYPPTRSNPGAVSDRLKVGDGEVVSAADQLGEDFRKAKTFFVSGLLFLSDGVII